GQDKVARYRDEFFRPYMRYPGKIIAIPGNHDGETFPTSDREPLQAFIENFCAPQPFVPPLAAKVGIVREMVAQPGVYWRLDAPFVDIIGLYSNVLEGPGALEGQGDDATQKQWLLDTLGAILKERRDGRPAKALIIAVHHPPFSGGGHSG